MAIPQLFISFFPNPLLTFDNVAPMKYRINTKINSHGKVISSCLEGYKTTLHVVVFFFKFCKQHQVEIWSKIITIWCIKRSQKKNKHCKWKKRASLLQNPCIINEKQSLLPSIDNCLNRLLPSIFTRKSWTPPSTILQKS